MTSAIVQVPPAQVALITQSTDLHALEEIVERGLRHSIEAGFALLRIKQGELYRATHDTWEQYLDARWPQSSRHARRMMRAAVVCSGPVGPLPTERHAREIARIEDPEEQAEAWAEAKIDYGPEPTAAQLKTVVDKRVGGKKQGPSLQERRTPRWLFELLSQLYGGFALDAFAEPHNALCDEYFTAEQNALDQPWKDPTFCNHPFMLTEKVVPYAHKQWLERGVRTCMLAPIGCSQGWYHEYAKRHTVLHPDVRFNFDMPDGTPTDDADRDTMVIRFGGADRNTHYQERFEIQTLECKAALAAAQAEAA